MTADLLDSSVLIAFLRDDPGRAAGYVDEALRSPDRPGFTEPVEMELLVGAGSPRELAHVERLLQGLPRLSVVPRVDYSDAAALFRAARRAGRTIRSENDCLIAAVALRRGVRVVHRDGDFEEIARIAPLRALDLR